MEPDPTLWTMSWNQILSYEPQHGTSSCTVDKIELYPDLWTVTWNQMDLMLWTITWNEILICEPEHRTRSCAGDHDMESDCLTLFDPSQRNWFRKSQLTSMVAIDLQKPYAKTKLGKYTCMMFIDSVDGC